jgi:hypothetical protein
LPYSGDISHPVGILGWGQWHTQSQISDSPSRAETGSHRQRPPLLIPHDGFIFSAAFPGCHAYDNASMPESHPDPKCNPGFGSAVGSARASVNISLSIPSIFRPAPGPSLAGYADGHQPTFTLYGKMLILDPGHVCCWPSSCPTMRAGTDSLGNAMQFRPVRSSAALGCLARAVRPNTGPGSPARPRGIDQ